MRSNSRQHTAGKLLKKTKGVAPELTFEVLSCHFFQCRLDANTPQEMLLLDWRKQ